MNEQEYVTTPLWNVIGVINGTISDEVVVIGNHRDAWIAGGAGDPNSGSATLNEVIRSFGEALEAGWKPLRTIVFGSWDGEEYGLVGSTEWVEEYIPWLSSSVVAYLNVDVASSGTHLHVAAAPLLNKLIYDVTSLVPSPEGGSVRDRWTGNISTMGSGSDFTAFQDFAGIPSLDLGYAPGGKDALYQYHSNYDSFHWMEKFGDPSFEHHTTVAKLWALMAAKLVESPVLPLNATDYATGLKTYLNSVKKVADESSLSKSFQFKHLEHAILGLHEAAVQFDAYTSDLASQADQDLPWWKWWQKVRLFYKIRQANTKYKLLERAFLHQEGLDKRPWFKHIVFAPGRWTGYAGATFPGLVESFEDNDLVNANRWSDIIEERLKAATTLLEV